MPSIQLLTLIAAFLVTSIISVITGSTSLITVPVMLQTGIEPRTALATNMMALTFMSIGATLPFLKQKTINLSRLPLLILLTLVGSGLGAALLLFVPSKVLPQLVSVFMIAIVIFSLLNHRAGVISKGHPSKIKKFMGYVATLILGIYGGFFSGGYVTMLTAAYVGLFQMTYVEAIATTKLVNIFSSLFATCLFTLSGIIDYPLGIVLSITMFVGGIIGSKIALKLNNLWLRRIFLVTVIILAIKTMMA
ncbi:sulfite exporter TauE/SafE family protein [Pseudanabaena yagii GIHE-NHR1]|uniref:Probable membrane transporter protein n=1 Tax=Pseudanabaena yagii GIHE-NHR1 TaxID=2722753 RepID=A0ABX1LLJ0_9CYAN|nr:sulfite exporter TauE/SafE family protein [Pseudanabaena yagii GIHE-NHR1]